MCLLVVCNTRKMTEKEIEGAWRSNKDGAGFAFVDGNGNHCYLKGFMKLEDFKAAYEHMDTRPHIVHFRQASSGGVSPEMTHPFECTPESELRLKYVGKNPVLFHNGVLSSWEEMLWEWHVHAQKRVPPGRFSDTRALALMLATIGQDALHFVNGKFAVLENGKISMYGAFEHDEGAYFSNSNYKWGSYTYTKVEREEPKVEKAVGLNGKEVYAVDYVPDMETEATKQARVDSYRKSADARAARSSLKCGSNGGKRIVVEDMDHTIKSAIRAGCPT